MSQLQSYYQGYIRPSMCLNPLVPYHILTPIRRKLDYEDYESEDDDDEAEEAEERDSDNESFHEALENLALEEKRQIPIPVA